jgi:hypothetical protein
MRAGEGVGIWKIVVLKTKQKHEHLTELYGQQIRSVLKDFWVQSPELSENCCILITSQIINEY